MSEAAPGTIVGGDFRILRPLQAGGMGAVYVAEQLSTGKQRALKLMHARLVDDPVQRQRFVREARVAAKVESEHVVEVLAAGVTEKAAIPWLAMELLRGCDLSRLIRENGPLSLAQALPIMEQLCHGLGAAHEAGIVHRDLKPQNVFLCRLASSTRPWAVKVLDFGIAKVVADRNQTTAALGSPAWMAPEQTDTSSDMAPAADVWALGLVMFWMLTGRFYWKAMGEQNAGVQAVLREMLFEPLMAPSVRAQELGDVAFPESLDDWFLRCVQRDPDDRYKTANIAWETLRNATGDDVPHSQFLPPEVAEIAARAAEDLTPEVPAPPSQATRQVAPSSSSRAGDEAETRREGAPSADETAESSFASSPPSAGNADTPEQGPTLQSHELGVAREQASTAGPGWVKWLLAAAFVVGAAGAVAISQNRPASDAAPVEVTSSAPNPSTSASAVTTAPPPVGDPIGELLRRAESERAAGRLDEAERLAGQALGELGALNGRRPVQAAINAHGDHAQIVLAQVAIARGRLAAPLPDEASKPDVKKAIDARSPFLVEAGLDCSKAQTWLGHDMKSCCQTHVAAAWAEVESAAKRAGMTSAPWAQRVDEALASGGQGPSCRALHLRLRDRHKPTPKPSGPSPSGPKTPPMPTGPAKFSASRARAALNAKVNQARVACRDFLGKRAHGFSVTFQPSGYARAAGNGPLDPAGRCIQGILSRATIPEFDKTQGPQTLSVTVAL